MEVESTISGMLAKVTVEEGRAVDEGTVLALIESGESVPGGSPLVAAPATPVSPPKAEKNVSASAPLSTKGQQGMFARNRAAASPLGKSTENQARLPVTYTKLSPARRTAGRRLQESKQTVPHFYLQTSFNAERVMAARTAASPVKLLWDAFFVKALSNILPRFSQMACRFENEQLVEQETDSIGVAADIDGDLYVVPVEDPQDKGIGEISQCIRARVEAIRSGESSARAIRPSVMTISNLGACNVETFTAIINPPESAILAIGKIGPVVVATDAGTTAVQQRANLTPVSRSSRRQRKVCGRISRRDRCRA